MTTFQIQNIPLDRHSRSPLCGSKRRRLANSPTLAKQRWKKRLPLSKLCANEIRKLKALPIENLVHVNLKRKYIIQRSPLDGRPHEKPVPLES